MRRIQYYLGLAAIILSITLISCDKDDCKETNNTCNVSNPAEELVWLKEAIDNAKQDEYSYFVMATYKKETVFYYNNCNPGALYVSTVMNCSGDNLGYTNDLYNKLTNRTTIWKHENSKCDI
ncbi:MAG: hypothetical protein WA749_15610 [Gelidibacter sp.]